ncbi:hypothetical protein ACL02U_08505 [Streptomyces sp. MS06]|uniref:hypothetical protein n=1 Tax=Streptomyces sp. MS06 TaxID=3385974 RepID=UPI00399F2A5F
MGMKDKFQDQAEQMQQQAKKKFGQGREEAGERSSRQQPQQPQQPQRGRPERDDAERDAQERFDQDYDM